MSEAPTPSPADIAPAVDAPPPPPTPDAPAPTAPPPDITAADPAPTELSVDPTESPTADAKDTEPTDSIDLPEAPTLDMPEIPTGTEIADKKQAKEDIADAGYRIIGAGVKAAEDRFGNLPADQQETWLAENPGLKALLEFRTILNQKDGLLGGDKKGLVIGSEASPVKIAIRGADGIVQDVVITKLLKSSKGNFTCEIAGSTTSQEVSHEYIAKAFLSSAKDNVLDAIPETQQGLVAKYIDILTADVMVTGEDPLKDMSQEQVDALVKSENTNVEKPWEIVKILGDAMTDSSFIEDVAKGHITHKEIQASTVEVPKELFNKSPGLLTQAEKDVVRKAVRDKLENKAGNDAVFKEQQNPSYQTRMLTSTEVARLEARLDRSATDDEIKQIQLKIIRDSIVSGKIGRLSDPKYMEELQKKFGWKDIAGLILFLTKDIGVHFAPSPQQHR